MVKAYIKNAMVNYIIIKVIYIEAALKMDWSMELVHRISEMEIFIKVNM
jgi:hypothetical protein